MMVEESSFVPYYPAPPFTASRDRDREWSKGLIERAVAETWSEEALLTLLRAMPVERWVWQRISEIDILADCTGHVG